MPDKPKDNFRCGMVSIVGRPNVGKSTLLNSILDEKVAIVSKVPQTTRNQIRGIYTNKNGQIIFLDTPGVHLTKDKLDHFMNRTSLDTLKEADCVIHLVDTTRSIGDEEQMVVDRLKKIKTPIVLGLNKIDKKGVNIPGYIALWEEAKGKPIQKINDFTLLTLSGKTGFNIDKLLEIVFGYLPRGRALYPENIICDIPQRIAMADIIREKLLNIMREEVPHSLAVAIEGITHKRRKVVHIHVRILVERESQKEIVIGKGGSVLKKIGTLAREELESLLEKRVFLDIHVKLKKKWRDDSLVLEELGYGY